MIRLPNGLTFNTLDEASAYQLGWAHASAALIQAMENGLNGANDITDSSLTARVKTASNG